MEDDEVSFDRLTVCVIVPGLKGSAAPCACGYAPSVYSRAEMRLRRFGETNFEPRILPDCP